MGDVDHTVPLRTVVSASGFGDERLPPAELVFADAPLPYLVTDTHGVILLANRAGGVLLGRLPPELVGVPVTAFSGPPAGGLRRVVTAAAASAAPREAALALCVPRHAPRQVRLTVQQHAVGTGDPVLLWLVHPSPTAGAVPLVHEGEGDTGLRSLIPLREQIRAGPVPPSGPETFAAGVVELSSRLIAETDLAEALARVAAAALRGIPEAEGASAALLDPPVLGASDGRVERADRAQYDEGHGPAPAAVAEGRVVVADDVAGDERWPRAGPRIAAESGFRAVLAVPLAAGRDVRGVLTLYAGPPGRFGPEAVERAERFAVPAEVRLANVEAYRASVHVADELRRGLVSRAVIDQAKGILMAQHGLDADQAFAVLTRFSQQENRKLRDVAGDLVASSVREARVRHARGTGPPGAR
jgi:predicted kinase